MTLSDILFALSLERPGEKAHSRMSPIPKIIPEMEGLHNHPPVPSAVTALLVPRGEDWDILFIRRTRQGKYHGGQIALPGGKVEKNDPNKQATALRECQEEIGIPPSDITIIGKLSDIYVPLSNFNITPYVGTLDKIPNFVLSRDEVDEVIPIPLQQLLDERNKKIQPVKRNNHEVMAPGYQIGKNFIWGATAMIIAELETLLKHEKWKTDLPATPVG